MSWKSISPTNPCPSLSFEVTLDRSLTYCWHLESLGKKLTSRIVLLRRLAGYSWGAGATTLWTASLALVHSATEYCAPVWCCSAHTHFIDSDINDALRIVTGCLRLTPADNLPILAGIHPAELNRDGATLSPARRAMEPGHLLHSALSCPSSADAQHLKSRHPFVAAAQQLISSSDNNTCAAHWADQRWNAEWADNPTRLRIFIPNTGTHPLEWLSQEKPGSGLTTSTPVLGVSTPVGTNGVWPHLQPVSVGQKNKPSTMLPSNVQSIDLSWNAWPDGSGRWDNRMAAQHLPWGLVRPTSG